jgi:alpha-L-fucosidase
MLRFKKIIGICLLLLVVNCCFGAGEDYLKADLNDVARWQEMRLGMFVCWGPVSIIGQEIGWSRGGIRRGLPTENAVWGDLSNAKLIGYPVEEYDQLYKKFNPEQFNADEWVRLIKDSGMKYILFLTKHHDGFCMFDSKYTDYDIMSSPYGKDICKEVADACHKEGIRVCWYYSQPDWHYPDYFTENHAKYIEYFHNQVRELLTNYGEIDVIWFDGLYSVAKDWDAERLFKMIRQLQPGILINGRCGLAGDFETPEQTIGQFMRDRAWESCITMGTQWSWKPDDKLKSVKECLRIFIQCIGGDGNLALDTGPMPDGRIEPRQAEQFREMGQWIKKYDCGIYGTRGGPFKPGMWGASTCKGDKIYLYIMNWPDEGALEMPAISMEIKSSKVLSGGKANIVQTGKGITIDMAAGDRGDVATVIELTIAGKAFDIKPVVKSDAVSFGKAAQASSFYQNNKEYDPAKAFDEDSSTRWAADVGQTAAWLEVDLGSEATVKRAVIDESGWDRVKKFELQCKDGENWKNFYAGSTIGKSKEVTFEAVSGRYFRLNILESSDIPTIWEFQLFTDIHKK